MKSPTQPRWIAAAVLVLGLSAACASALWQDGRNETAAAQRFDALAVQVADQVASQLRIYQYGLRGAGGAIVAGGLENASRTQFANYAATRDIEREFPGARGFGIVRRVEPRDEASFVEAARRDGWPDFTVRQLKPHDAQRYIIQYMEPTAPNRAAIGLDIASEPERRRAADTAMRSGSATLTAPIGLVQATAPAARGFLLLMPIYQPGAPISSPEERTAATFGWAYAPLFIDEVLRDLYRTDAPYALSLRDVEETGSPAFYDTAASEPSQALGPVRRIPIPMFGRNWEASVSARPAFVSGLNLADPSKLAMVVAAIGLLLSALAYLLAHGVQRSRAERMEKARRAAIVDGSFDAIIGQSLAGIVTDWNAGAERLFGYPASFAVGREAASLLLPKERQAEDARMREAVSRGERVAPFDTTRCRRDGTLLEVSVTAAPIVSEEGVCVGLAKIVRDVSQARQSQRDLADLNASLERIVDERTEKLDAALRDLAAILDAVPSMIGYWDRHLVNRVANKAYGDWFGIDPAAVRGMHLRQLLGDTLFSQSLPYAEAALRGEAQVFERAIPWGAGRGVRHALVHYLPDLVENEVRGFYVLVHDVSELVEGRLKLAAVERDSEALLRTIRRHAIVSVADSAGRIVEVNDNFCQISGYERSELIGQKHSMLDSGEQDAGFWSAMWQAIGNGESWRAEVCNRAKSGELYWVNTVVAPFVGPGGSIEKYVAIQSDITVRKRMEDEVQLVNERFSVAADSVGLGVWEYDIVAGTLVWDDRMYALYGRVRSAGVESFEVWSGSLHPEDKLAAERALQDAIDGVLSFDTEFRVLHPDGTLRYLKATAQTVRDSDGRALRMTGVNIDVTDRAHAERELHKTMAMLNAVLASATQASIIAVKPDGLISVFNSGAERLLGYRAEEVIDRETSLLFHDRDEMQQRAQVLSEELGRPVRTGMVLVDPSALGHSKEWTYRRKDGGAVPVSLAVTAMRDDDGQLFGYLGIAHDISTQKKYEQSLREAMHQANHANNAKSQFLANMSHEIRTPMNAVIGLSYLLERTPLDDEQAALLAKIKLASKSLLTIINDVPDLSKIEASEMRIERAPFSVKVLLADLSALMALQAEAKGIEFDVDTVDAVPEAVEGDAMRLHQVLTNLLSNAIKFSERGAVRLAVHVISRAPQSVRLRFEVEDSGIGIEPDALARLFKPFVQADSSTTRRFGGTGLGLSIVKQLVDLMGGEIAVNSVPGEGSQFWVSLDFPLASADAIREATEIGPLPMGLALAGVRVLVVDDSSINLEVASRILEREGATVFLAGNGQEAVDHLLLAPDGVDIVLMDLQMPVLDGHDAARRIRSGLGLARLPIIALTAGISAENSERAAAAGMNDIVGKPFDPPQLVRCIQRHLLGTEVPRPQEAEAAQPPLVHDWPLIAGIDEHDAAMRLGGDPALFLSLLARFLKDLGDFDAPVCPLDHVALAVRMHKLKGIAGMLGARRIAQLAMLAETAGGAGDDEEAEALLKDLALELQNLKEAAATWLVEPAPAKPHDPHVPPPALDLREAEALLMELDDSDLGALDRFARLGPQLQHAMDPAAYAMLQGMIESLRFTEAAQLLDGNLRPMRAESPSH